MRSPLNDALNRKWSEASATLEKLERELAAERERADRAKAEGIKEGMRRAAAMAGTMAERPFDSEPEFSAVLAVEAAILKEIGE